MYEQALQLDPTSIVAMTQLALALTRGVRSEDDLVRAAKLIGDASAIDPVF